MKKLIVTRQGSQIVDMTPEEEALKLQEEKDYIAIGNLRDKRNRLLAETDWMANSDVTMSDNWKTYRQELRDLPSGLDTVEKVEAKEFPTKPSE